MKRIVIADDSATARLFARKCLEITGFSDAEFVEASNGKEALEALSHGATTLLVTDLNMPDIDGLRLLLQVRSSPKLKDIPVFIVTSAKNPAKERELMALGAQAVLPKPVSPSLMAQAVKALAAI